MGEHKILISLKDEGFPSLTSVYDFLVTVKNKNNHEVSV